MSLDSSSVTIRLGGEQAGVFTFVPAEGVDGVATDGPVHVVNHGGQFEAETCGVGRQFRQQARDILTLFLPAEPDGSNGGVSISRGTNENRPTDLET
jgi:hypothetical protein